MNLHQDDARFHGGSHGTYDDSQASGRLRFELRLAQARRWKWHSVHLVQKDRSARQCLWALSMDSTKNNKYNKNKVPCGIWLRIRGYLADTASRINDYLFRRDSARRQWADQASSYGQSADTAITFDNVYALASALTDVHLLRASRLAIQNWIVAYAVSKIVMIQSVVRGWLTRVRSREQMLMMSLPVSNWWRNFQDDPDGPTSPTLNCVAGCRFQCCAVNSLPVTGVDVVEEIYEEWDIIIIQRWWRSRCAVMTSLVSGHGDCGQPECESTLATTYTIPEAEDVDDAVVLAASEAVSAVTRLSGASRQFRSAITFAVDKDWLSGWRSLITVFDTAAMINMVAESVVDSSWKYVDGNSAWSTVTSVDGVKIAVGGRVIIPGHSMVLNGRILPMIATVVKSIPNQVELLIGLPVILSPEYNLLPDLATWRVHVRVSNEVVRLDLISRMLARRAFGPINIFCLCSGMCIEIAVLIELGFDVVFAYAVEASAATREISGAAFPMIKFSEDGYVENNTLCDQEFDFFAGFAGPQCVHWSVLRDRPGGYKEDGSSTFTSCAARLAAEHSRCGCFRLLETVQVHSDLVGDIPRQERECGGPLQDLNANSVGGPAGRNRRYFIPDVDVSAIERFNHINPDLAADSGWQFRDKPVPAPVARDKDTKSPVVMIKYRGNWEPRFASADERDRLNPGLAAGISCGYGRLLRVVEDSIRNRCNGNAFSADAIWSITRLWQVPSRIPSVLVVVNDMRSWPSEVQLAKFALMSDDQMWKYFEGLSLTLVMPKLDIAALVDPVHTTGYQTSAPGYTRSGLGPSCDYCIDLAIHDGTHKDVEWSADLWICLCFFQKKGRKVTAEFDGASYKKGDVLEAMRPLRDYTKLNSALALRIPEFWREFCPTVENLRAMFPAWCKFMAVHDCKNAHHSVKLTDSSHKFCNSKFIDSTGRRRIIQGIGCDQGISAIALFFPLWIRFGYNFFFGEAWLLGQWFLDFVDDTLCTGRTEAECILKMKILNISKHFMGLEVSSKQDVSVYKQVLFVGLHWSAAGISIGDDAVAYILECLNKTPIGVKQARMVRGVLVQAKSAFDFRPSELLRFAELLAVITACIVEGEASGKYSTSSEMKDVLQEFAGRLKDQPRRYTNPDRLIGDDRCLALLGDADPSAVVTSLWIIMKANANDVVPADFECETSILLGVHPKTLSGSAVHWHISEKELMVMVFGVIKFGKLISEVIARWTLTADQSDWKFNQKGQLIAPIPKICFASDSKAALGMLNVLRLPSGKLEHLTPKIERVTGWAEDCAETLYWPIARLFVPGEGGVACNSLCDYIVRFVGALGKMRGVQIGETRSEETVPSPMLSAVLVSGLGSYDGVPDGMQLMMLPYSEEDWIAVHKAYLLDQTMHFGVALCDIYKFANGLAIPDLLRRKIEPWMNNVFYAVCIGGDEKKFLCHRRSCMQPYDSADFDRSKILVPVVPVNVMIRISGRPPYSPTEDETSAEDLPVWQAEDLRADILWWAHYCRTPHSRKAQTIERAMSVAWWPGIDTQAKMEYRLCAVCNDIRLVLSGVGLGMQSQARFAVIQMDDAKLSPELKKLTGFVSVLSIICICTGAVVYIPRKEMDCTSTAFHIFTGWVKENGWFRVLKSDSDPAYASKLVSVLLKLAGVDGGVTHVHSSLGSHSKYVERSNVLIRKVLKQADKYADLTCARDLEVFIASAQIEANQLAVADGTTVFERTRGIRPISTQDLISIRAMPDCEYAAAVKAMKCHEKHMIDLLRDRCSALMAERLVQQEKRAEYNFSSALNAEATKNVHDMSVHEGMGLHDTVSYKGDCYVMELAEPEGEWPPSRVFLRSPVSPSNAKWVAWSAVRPLAIDREPLLLPRSYPTMDPMTLSVDDVLVYSESCDDPSMTVRLGLVMSVTATHAVVQYLQPAAATVVTFVRVWKNDEDSSDLKRRVLQPSGFSPVCHNVENGCFVTVVVLQKNHTLDSASRKYLESLGIAVDVKGHSSS